jgi:hypothetical protein
MEKKAKGIWECFKMNPAMVMAGLTKKDFLDFGGQDW